MAWTPLRNQLSIHVPYVCVRCRQQSKTLSRQIRAVSFTSLEELVDNDGNNLSVLGDIGVGRRGSPRKSSSASSETPLRLVRHQDRRIPDQVDKSLQGLFLSKQSEDPSRLSEQYLRFSNARAQERFTGQDSTEHDLRVLNQMLFEEKGHLKEFLRHCKETIETEARKSSADRFEIVTDHTSSVSRDIFKDILIRVCRSRSRDSTRHCFVPTYAEVISLYLKHQIMRGRWHVILGIQIGAFLEWVHDPVSAEVTREISDNAAPIFEDLLNIWAIFLEEHRTQQRKIGTGTSPLITLDKNQDSTSKSRASQPSSSPPHGFSKVEDNIAANLSDHPESQVLNLSNQRIIAAAAIVTDRYFQLLVENNLPISKSTASAKSFLEFSEKLASESNLDRRAFKGLSTNLVEYGTPLHIVDKALAGCGMPRSKAMLEYPVPRKGLVTPDIKITNDYMMDDNITWNSSQVTSLLMMLNGAIPRSDTGCILRLWKDFQARPMRKDVTDSLRDRAFIRFIDAFFILRRPKLAVEVWNLMVKSGLMPKQKHWSAMMVGAAGIKDLASMRTCWSQMKGAGIEPDGKSWTAWIHGLILCGEWRLGIEALEELGRLWKKAHNGEIQRLSPSIEPVNAAISAVLSINMPHLVPRIFNWAKLQKVPLDISIFNIMLRSAISKDETQGVDRLLSEMRSYNCQPDIGTFTIFLDGLLKQPKSSFHTQKPEAQKGTILTLLKTLEKRGLCITGQTYSTILSGLLAPETVNINAARAVLEHMVEHKVPHSSHVYTILMRYYFSTTPPDLPAIDSLWSRVQRDKNVVDSFLFNCMVEGYAQIGDIEKMLQLARQMAKEGRSPSWASLLTMLRALLRAKESDLANEFVDDVADRRHGLLRHGEDVEKKAKLLFWNTVVTLREQGWLRWKKDRIKDV